MNFINIKFRMEVRTGPMFYGPFVERKPAKVYVLCELGELMSHVSQNENER